MEKNTIKKMDVAILGGVGFNSYKEFKSRAVSTPYGKVTVYLTQIRGKNVAIVPRHAGKNHTPPHKINYRANIWAVKALGAERIISTNSVGSMKGHPVGSFVLLDDFIDFTRSRPLTFYDETTIHIDLTEPYCSEIKTCFTQAFEKRGLSYSEGIYACTEGPRFETRAEIRLLSQFADVVGMTGFPEVALAKELELCYAALALVTNQACGMSPEKLTADEVTEVVGKREAQILEILEDTIENLPEIRKCKCCSAKLGASL
ncbi:MAG: S-methyl-5'-thioadenosine phosphorylase [Methanosarcinaceae archaeon]|nr:S-methyl-5'-thioadenosine phosphorylase [Methanosarcinaceae archaeon]MDD4331501.1 S-methyl-5'-thioadenosine phosphorylase [Methanosarcinaceae archaeon]MDD4748388.1 S-methyl-5'-thioadenosine phosphorylase [Methanosarcinaceae archaeon]